MNRTEPYGILIVCEDRKSSAFYFEGKRIACGIPNGGSYKLYSRNDVIVDVKGLGKAPISVVNHTIKMCNNQFDSYRDGGFYFYKEAYCVMDVDDHHTLKKALLKIKEFNSSNQIGCKIYPIVSNECFEVWYILHFKEYSTRELYRNSKTMNPKTKLYIREKDNIDLLLNKYLGSNYKKSQHDIFEKIKNRGGNEMKAISYAKRLERHHL